MSSPLASQHILISGGEGDLACALKKEFAQDEQHVHAPGRDLMDVRDEAQVANYFSKLDRLDILIANAALTRDGVLAGLSSEDFTEVMNTNLRGAFLCSRAALKLMVKQRSGHILFIGSRAARYGTRGQSAYAASKAGLVGLAQTIAKEYGPRNIRCNVVLPGFLETKMTAGLSGSVLKSCEANMHWGVSIRRRMPRGRSRFYRGWIMSQGRSLILIPE